MGIPVFHKPSPLAGFQHCSQKGVQRTHRLVVDYHPFAGYIKAFIEPKNIGRVWYSVQYNTKVVLCTLLVCAILVT